MFTVEQLVEKISVAEQQMDYVRHPEGLYRPIRYILSEGGKRIRPLLVLMAYNLFKDDVDDAMSLALGLELYHNHTLMHDDVMDNADMRRNKPTVHKVWNENTAILSGDAMLLLACKYVSRVPEKYAGDIMSLFLETALEICEGQQLDMEFERRNDVSAEEYIEMIRLKTAVLLACSLKGGAMLGGVSADDAEKIYNFGLYMGLTFQLQDDLLDVYGDPAVFGKNIGGDILCDKKTFLLIKAEELAMGQQREILDKYIGNQNCDREEKIKAVISVYNALDVRGLCEERMEQYFERGMEALDEMSVPAAKKTVLKEFAISLLHRNL